MTNQNAPDDERLGQSDILGVSTTVGDVISRLQRLSSPDLPIYSGRNNKLGIAFHHHAFVDPSKDYVSFTHIEYTDEVPLSDSKGNR